MELSTSSNTSNMGIEELKIQARTLDIRVVIYADSRNITANGGKIDSAFAFPFHLALVMLRHCFVRISFFAESLRVTLDDIHPSVASSWHLRGHFYNSSWKRIESLVTFSTDSRRLIIAARMRDVTQRKAGPEVISVNSRCVFLKLLGIAHLRQTGGKKLFAYSQTKSSTPGCLVERKSFHCWFPALCFVFFLVVC